MTHAPFYQPCQKRREVRKITVFRGTGAETHPLAIFFAMNRCALFCWIGFCAYAAPLAASEPSGETHSFSERLRMLFGPRAESCHYDPRMVRAAEIASARAFKKPTWRCWHYVKDALLRAGVISSRPVSPWAKQAGDELCSRYGFRRLKITNPLQAPVGAVVVYGGEDAGHVELRTASGFVSDFASPTPYPRPLIGVYVKEI